MSPFDTTHFLTPSPHQNRRRRARVEKVGLSAPGDWSVSRRLGYVRWAEAVAAGLRQGLGESDAWLEQQFETAASMAIEIHGANGYTNDYPVGRLWRDAKL